MPTLGIGVTSLFRSRFHRIFWKTDFKADIETCREATLSREASAERNPSLDPKVLADLDCLWPVAVSRCHSCDRPLVAQRRLDAFDVQSTAGQYARP